MKIKIIKNTYFAKMTFAKDIGKTNAFRLYYQCVIVGHFTLFFILSFSFFYWVQFRCGGGGEPTQAQSVPLGMDTGKTAESHHLFMVRS
ncbi:hypothetical protein GNP80_14985 [Aliivibrio fischeri]|uniref:hypothetical protein n=1 Tax=Aliivibrio fischeri TaxID=668 RepID=UPI0012DA2B12|nr:hypothetical protein [Aliivibrio fischeri]MUK93734.1 hypothetical protein [Aliivibrio fischeri]